MSLSIWGNENRSRFQIFERLHRRFKLVPSMYLFHNHALL